MPIREFDEIKLAVLNYVADKREYSQRIIVDALEDCLSLTDEERNRRVPSGKRVFYNSCVTAIDRLMKRNLLVRTIPGHYRITSSGLEFLRQNSGSTPKSPTPLITKLVHSLKNLTSVMMELAQSRKRRLKTITNE